MNYMAEANAIAAVLRGKASPTGRKATEPTPRNWQVLAFMREFFAQNDQLPPVSVTSSHFGWQSMGAAHSHVDALLRHGLVERNAVGKLRFARGVRA